MSLVPSIANIYAHLQPLTVVSAHTGLSKVLAKEVAPFNIRVLTIGMGAFNTNMPNAVRPGGHNAPLPADYRGSAAEQIMQLISGGKMVPSGDKDKAMRAVYELVVGEGRAGAGLEAERYLPLGSDMVTRVKEVRDYLQHSLDVFEDVGNSVGIDK